MANQPPVRIGEQIKIYDFNGKLVHEGLTVSAPNSFEAWRDDGNGVWTYFFHNLCGGVSLCTPHRIEYIDGTGFAVKAQSYFEATI